MTQIQKTCDEIIAALRQPLSWYFGFEITRCGFGPTYRINAVIPSVWREIVFEGTLAEASAVQTELTRTLRVYRRLTS